MVNIVLLLFVGGLYSEQSKQCIFRENSGIDEMYNPEEDYQRMLDRLDAIRVQKKMSKYALAKAMGMSSSSMSNLLNG